MNHYYYYYSHLYIFQSLFVEVIPKDWGFTNQSQKTFVPPSKVGIRRTLDVSNFAQFQEDCLEYQSQRLNFLEQGFTD